MLTTNGNGTCVEERGKVSRTPIICHNCCIAAPDIWANSTKANQIPLGKSGNAVPFSLQNAVQSGSTLKVTQVAGRQDGVEVPATPGARFQPLPQYKHFPAI